MNRGKKGEQIMRGLEVMYERVSKTHKARLLAMTTMPLSASDKPFYAAAEEERQKLNKLIRHWISSAAAIKADDRPVLVDMDKLIPFTSTTTLFSPDGLHLSAEGYDRMGQEIYNGLSPFL